MQVAPRPTACWLHAWWRADSQPILACSWWRRASSRPRAMTILRSIFHCRVRGSLVVGTLKYHAACYLTHSSIEAIQLLRRQLSFSGPDVASIDINVAPGHLSVCNIAALRSGLEECLIRHAKLDVRASLERRHAREADHFASDICIKKISTARTSKAQAN